MSPWGGLRERKLFFTEKYQQVCVEGTIEFRQWMLKTTGWKVIGEYGECLHSDKEYWNSAKVSLTPRITY